MRLSALFIGLILSHVAFSQLTYSELERHNDMAIKVITTLENGDIIGFYDFPAKLMKSSDNGDSWELFYEGPEIDNFSVSVWNTSFRLVMKSYNGDLYLVNTNKLYRYISPTDPLEMIMEVPGAAINDFEFLNDEEILIAAAIRDMAVYDLTGWKLREYEFKASTFGKIDGQSFYAFANNTIKRFDHALNELASFNNQTPVRKYANGRIYTFRNYTEDEGQNWISYEEESSFLYVDNQGVLVTEGFNPDKLFVSNDGGDSYSEMTIPVLEGAHTVWSTGDCNLIYTDLFGCEIHPIYHTNDCGLTWLQKENRRATPHAEKVIVGPDNNIVIGTCREISYYKQSLNDPWETYEDPLFSDEIFVLESGTLLASNNYRSVDGGATWQDDLPFFATDFHQRGNKIFALNDFQNLYYTSEDDGMTWDTIDPGFEPIGLMGPETVYGIDFNGLTYWDENGELVNYDFGFSWCSNYESAFDVNHLYFVRHPGGNGAPGTFMFTYDGGKTWNETNFPFPDCTYAGTYHLKSDKKGRLLLWGERVAAVSYDAGLTWRDITPTHPDLYRINDVTIARDNHVYIAGDGTGILTSNETLEGRSSVVKVKVFLDEDGDCTFDDNEEGLENIFIEIGPGFKSLTDKDGEVELIVSGDSYEVLANFNPEFYASCNSSMTIDIVEDEENLVYIPLEIIRECADVEINAGTPFLRRCFDNTFSVRLDNFGSVATEDLQIIVELDEHFNFNGSSFEVLEEDGNRITLGVDAIGRNQHTNGTITFNLSCEAPLGWEHYTNIFLVEYENPCFELDSDAQYFQCMPNIGSWDPNDKTSFVDGFQLREVIEENSSLEYKIRFQNTGSDTAFNVRIVDDLPEYFDASTIRPLVASHDFTWHLERSILVINFPDIALVDSTTNEMGSHGFVQFEVGVDPNTDPGSLIENEARIYFDFNEPIITNKTENYYLCEHGKYDLSVDICEGESYQEYTTTGLYLDTLSSVFGCDSIQLLFLNVLPSDAPGCLIESTHELITLDIKAFPNPTNDRLYLVNNELGNDYRIKIYSPTGVEVFSSEVMLEEIDLSSVQRGVYFLEVLGEQGRYLEKLFVL